MARVTDDGAPKTAVRRPSSHVRLRANPVSLYAGDFSDGARPASLLGGTRGVATAADWKANSLPRNVVDRRPLKVLYFGAMGRRRLKWILAATVAFALVSSGSAVAAPAPSRVAVIIGFNQQPGPPEQALVRQAGGTIKYTYHLVSAIAATVPEPAIAGLLANPNVATVDLDGEVHIIDAELDNTWGVKHIGAGTVHDNPNKGTGVKVAVIDTGIDYTHPDLDGNYAGGYDFVNNDFDPMDDNRHGTHVAGTIAAEDDGVGVVGVAPGADLYGLKVLSSSGSGSWSDIIAALQWAVDNGIQVTNNSYGSGTNPGGTVEAAFDNSAAAGILHVAAAGNSGNRKGKGNNVGYPARFDSVIAVAATDSSDNRARFSSTGDTVELAAPGVAINSTQLGGGYVEFNGTSMASPHVAGTAALVIAAGITDVRTQLQTTADDLGKPGRDPHYGFGLVDADEAAPLPAANQAPVADAGPDQSVKTSSTAQLDGSNSSNPNGDPITYSWVLTSRPTDSTATLSGADTATPTFVANEDGSYQVELTVSNGELSSSDSVEITAAANQAPVADAGPDQSVKTSSTAQLDGSNSSDPNGDPITYSWVLTSKPAGSTATLSGADTATPTFEANEDGSYQVELTVSDGELSSSDSVEIIAATATEATAVSVDSITYGTEGGKNEDKHLLITVALVDDLTNPVGGASVSIDLFRDGRAIASGTGTTGGDGTVTFTLKKAKSGCYKTLVTDVATGLTWDGVTPTNEFCKK